MHDGEQYRTDHGVGHITVRFTRSQKKKKNEEERRGGVEREKEATKG